MTADTGSEGDQHRAGRLARGLVYAGRQLGPLTFAFAERARILKRDLTCWCLSGYPDSVQLLFRRIRSRLLIRTACHSLDFGRESAQSQAYNNIHAD